ncbi:MAG: hypothetical protein CME59_03410 [Halioglobus sp.]|nr:hypothetical protein [Halioglobus sp.]|tara:strand:+ start:653 stop:1267 length:615 start_codon:yes stop_codon:yes gene_type:complete
MARPSTPLIDKDKTLEVALEIVDNEGLAALSIRRLGKELNVAGYSLYHHFKNKEGILVALCKYVLDQIEYKEPAGQSWQATTLDSQMRAYEILSNHPNIVPAIIEHNLLGVRRYESEQVARYLADKGLPAEAILALIECQAILVAGFLSLESLEENFSRDASLEVDAPYLFELGKNAEFLSRAQLLKLVTLSLIDGIEKKYSLS